MSTVVIHGSKNISAFGRSELDISNPANFPDPNIISEMYEPIVKATIITPGLYFFFPRYFEIDCLNIYLMHKRKKKHFFFFKYLLMILIPKLENLIYKIIVYFS